LVQQHAQKNGVSRKRIAVCHQKEAFFPHDQSRVELLVHDKLAYASFAAYPEYLLSQHPRDNEYCMVKQHAVSAISF